MCVCADTHTHTHTCPPTHPHTHTLHCPPSHTPCTPSRGFPGCLPRPNLQLEYKFLVLGTDGTVSHWKPGSNYKLELPLLVSGGKVVKAIGLKLDN